MRQKKKNQFVCVFLPHFFLQLVGGEFDLETNFIIQDAESISCMAELLQYCNANCQAEVWSMFIAMLRKSVRNLQTSTEVGLIKQVLLKMNSVDDMIAGMMTSGSLLFILFISLLIVLYCSIKPIFMLQSLNKRVCLTDNCINLITMLSMYLQLNSFILVTIEVYRQWTVT